MNKNRMRFTNRETNFPAPNPGLLFFLLVFDSVRLVLEDEWPESLKCVTAFDSTGKKKAFYAKLINK